MTKLTFHSQLQFGGHARQQRQIVTTLHILVLKVTNTIRSMAAQRDVTQFECVFWTRRLDVAR